MMRFVKYVLVVMLGVNMLWSMDRYEFDERLRNAHELIGLGTLGLMATNATLGLIGENTDSDMDLHESIGTSLAFAMGANALMGAYANRETLMDFSDGVTQDHLHAWLGLASTGLIIAAANLEDNHKALALSGVLAGVTAFFTIKF